MSNATAEQVRFWLTRRIRELELAQSTPSDEDMAKRGLSYSERGMIHAAVERAKDVSTTELSAYREALRVYNEYTTPRTYNG